MGSYGTLSIFCTAGQAIMGWRGLHPPDRFYFCGAVLLLHGLTSTRNVAYANSACQGLHCLQRAGDALQININLRYSGQEGKAYLLSQHMLVPG